MGSEAEDTGSVGNGPIPARAPLTREQEIVIGQVLASKPMPLRPRAFQFEWVSAFGGLTIVVILITAWAMWYLAGKRASMVPYLVVGTAINSALAIGVAPYIRRRARAFIRLHEGFICPRCHYPLGSLPDDGQCPECATLYSRAVVVDMWRWSYKIRERFPTRGVHTASKKAEPVL